MIAVLKISLEPSALWVWHRRGSTGMRPAMMRMQPERPVWAQRRWQLVRDLIHSKPKLTNSLRVVSFMG